jgi:prepilin signal peptidase PulO-like enzyme (type II secretory pathway)
MILLGILFFIGGAIVASFVGVLVGRLNTGQSFLVGRSHCDACGALLTPRVLIPIFPLFASRARARCCGARVSMLGPVTEFVLGSLYLLAYIKLGFTLALLFFLIALTMLLALVLYDLAHQILPPVFLWIFIGASAIEWFLTTPSSELLWSILAPCAITFMLLLIYILSRGRAMGFSDAPLSFGLALLTGPVALSGFVFSFWIGAGIGIIILAKRSRGSRMGVEVPFAPFLAAGFLLAYFTQWNPFALIAALL